MKPWNRRAAVLVIALVAAYLLIGRTHERKEFVGRITQGTDLNDALVNHGLWYRCRFTVSPSWQVDKEPYDPTSLWESRAFTLLRSPIREWIDNHLLKKSSPGSPTINLWYGPYAGSRYADIVNGYPELYVMTIPYQTVMHRHLKIDGHPAVYVTLRTGSTRETALLVSIPEQDFMCEVNGSAEDTNFATLDYEMQQIVASFHIEKVAPPAGGKQ